MLMGVNPRYVDMKVGHHCKDHEGWAGWLANITILKAAHP